MTAANPIDVHVGMRVRQRRSLLGMSQTTLGNAVGLAFQQIQKYERGTNRVSSSRLFEFATILDVPISFFFAEMPVPLRHAKAGRRAPGPAGSTKDPIRSRQTLELVRAYFKIRNTRVRKSVAQTIVALGADQPPRRPGERRQSRAA